MPRRYRAGLVTLPGTVTFITQCSWRWLGPTHCGCNSARRDVPLRRTKSLSKTKRRTPSKKRSVYRTSKLSDPTESLNVGRQHSHDIPTATRNRGYHDPATGRVEATPFPARTTFIISVELENRADLQWWWKVNKDDITPNKQGIRSRRQTPSRDRRDGAVESPELVPNPCQRRHFAVLATDGSTTAANRLLAQMRRQTGWSRKIRLPGQLFYYNAVNTTQWERLRNWKEPLCQII
jgi:hypothetical protein